MKALRALTGTGTFGATKDPSTSLGMTDWMEATK
jgi:hypothetical protein